MNDINANMGLDPGASKEQVQQQYESKYEMVNVSSFAAKYRSKREIYRFIAYECKVLVPSIETVTMAHLSDIISGRKMSVQLEQLRPINVPYYKGLTIEAILQWGSQFPQVVDALPVPKECLKLERSFICNLIHTIVGPPFAKWVDDKVNERNQRVAIEGNQIINMDPIMAKIFKESTQVSTTNGNSCHMLKAGSKRRRTRAEIEVDKLSEKVSMREMQEALSKLQKVQETQV